jgi:sarcosine oxidase subunit alpha
MSDDFISSSSSVSIATPESGTGTLQVRVNGRALTVPCGTLAAAAIALAGIARFRSSLSEEPRGPLCGMGICMECRATINGRSLCRTCLIACEPGMEIETEAEGT